jgi:hypothetical protein
LRLRGLRQPIVADNLRIDGERDDQRGSLRELSAVAMGELAFLRSARRMDAQLHHESTRLLRPNSTHDLQLTIAARVESRSQEALDLRYERCLLRTFGRRFPRGPQ